MLASYMRVLRLLSHRVVRRRRRRGLRAGATHAGRCGPAGLHGRIAAAMCGLSAVGNAIVVCVSGWRRHHKTRKRERCRCRGGERLPSWLHLFFFLFLQAEKKHLQKIPQRTIAPRFTTAHLGAEPRSTMTTIRIAAMSSFACAAL